MSLLRTQYRYKICCGTHHFFLLSPEPAFGQRQFAPPGKLRGVMRALSPYEPRGQTFPRATMGTEYGVRSNGTWCNTGTRHPPWRPRPASNQADASTPIASCSCWVRDQARLRPQKRGAAAPYELAQVPWTAYGVISTQSAGPRCTRHGNHHPWAPRVRRQRGEGVSAGEKGRARSFVGAPAARIERLTASALVSPPIRKPNLDEGQP